MGLFGSVSGKQVDEFARNLVEEVCRLRPPEGKAGPGNPGAGVLALRAEAFGPRGAHTIIEMTVARPDAAGEGGGRARVLSWRQIR